MSKQVCNKCGHYMKNMGNISNRIYTTCPPQWDEVYVCHKCKEKKTVRVQPEEPRLEDFSTYKEQIHEKH